MNIKTIDEGEWCHYCHQEFNGVEEGFIQPLENGDESFYHLRCIGKLMVYRIEGVLPQHLFMACIDQLQKPLPESLLKKLDVGQSTLDNYIGDDEE